MLIQTTYSQQSVDSLLDVLSSSESKAEILNLLAEATLEDSLDRSFYYAKKAIQAAEAENNTNQEGIGWFSLAEAYGKKYNLDSAAFYYKKALPFFLETGDNYYVSYTYNNLGYIYHNYGLYLESLDQYLLSLPYIDDKNHADDLSHVYVNIGNTYHFLGKYHTAIKYFHKAVVISKRLQDYFVLPIAYNGLGLAYKYLANYDSAIHYYKAMIEIDKEHGDAISLAVDYGNMGSLYQEWEQYGHAFEYNWLAHQIYMEHENKDGLSTTASNIGQLHMKVGQYDSALYYLNYAVSIDEQTGKQQKLAKCYNNLGDLYIKMNRLDRAEKYYSEALLINQSNNSRYDVAINLKNIALVNQIRSDFSTAEKLLKESLKIAREIQAMTLVLNIMENFSVLYDQTGNYKKALEYQKGSTNLRDSLFKQQNQKTLADLQTQYELEKKENEIQLLSQKAELQETKTQYYKNRLIGVSISLLIILILGITLFVQNKLKNRAYKKLVWQSGKIARIGKGWLTNHSTSDTAEKNANKYKDNSNEELADELLTFMEDNKPYLKNDLTIKDLADELNTNYHYISEVINNRYKQNFSSWINEFRIKESCSLLSDPEKMNYTIEAIARESGFNTKSTFNSAFKSITGVTPSYYRKHIL